MVFLGQLPHYTKETKGERYNLIIYLKQETNGINSDHFYDRQYLTYLSYIGIRNLENNIVEAEVAVEIDKKGVFFSIPSLPRLRKI